MNNRNRVTVFALGFCAGVLCSWIILWAAGCTLVIVRQDGEGHSVGVTDNTDEDLIDVTTGGKQNQPVATDSIIERGKDGKQKSGKGRPARGPDRDARNRPGDPVVRGDDEGGDD